ncbi:MAG TPA: hypothetical protein VLF18_04860 [Tahibacter sp.]|uniref:hypothetical protein n=1 Tax=Tahibacter sp. TaxID=2056211 RepID=UPI002B91029F|nr:hypothetical protein [Tahibacter sp.]HSX59513.1 hypothetical protein [Tahibacter sp.]
MLSLLATIATVLCAMLCWRAAPRARFAARGSRRTLGAAAASCAAIALASAIATLGTGAGICLVIGVWMLTAVALPYLALLRDVAPAATGPD